MGLLAQGLGDSFRVLEPFQRSSGHEPLTVALHVADLEEFLEQSCPEPPALVGHSWGAMLALAYASAHPAGVRSLVLIGCGTFDPASRDCFRTRVEARMDDGLRQRVERLFEVCPEPDERLKHFGNLMLPVYSYDLTVTELDNEACDARAHDETWRDMLRLQEGGVYPSAFAAIEVPVLMLHGAVDPHPGRLIRQALQPHLPQLEYREWEQCGHYPWLERSVQDEFFAVLRQWLVKQSAFRGAAAQQGDGADERRHG
jgi:pimeloyl-ACP methyl ester carboxylesterase